MGLKLSFNLFAAQPASAVADALRLYYRRHWQRSVEIYQSMYGNDVYETLEIYDCPPHWTVVDIDLEPEDWIRQRHLFVSQALSCPGFYLFEYDGDYWGYEFFDSGVVIDRFKSDASRNFHFEGMTCAGDARKLAARLPFLNLQNIEPYLVLLPDIESTPEAEYDDFQTQTDVPPRPGDRYRRWDEGAMLNFLRALGVAGDFTGKWGRFELAHPLHAAIDATDFMLGAKDA
jgi:hypothetical protein